PVLSRVVEPLRVRARAQSIGDAALDDRDRDARPRTALAAIDADDRKRLRVEQPARASVDLAGHLAATQRGARRQTEQPLLNFLARSLLRGRRVRLRWIRRELRSRQRAGILRERHVEPHAKERQRRAAQVRRRTDERVRELLVRERAIAIALRVAEVAFVAERTVRSREQAGVAT